MKKNEKNSNLNSEQYYVLRGEGTEHPGSSSLNNEKRKGAYFCVGCGTKLFECFIKLSYYYSSYHSKLIV